jgi:hypothetical protein
MKKALFFLPHLYEFENASGEASRTALTMLKTVEKFYDALKPHFELKVLWHETDNHLTKEFLSRTSFAIATLKEEDRHSFLLSQDADLIIANGCEILDLFHDSRIPTLLHTGFLPQPVSKESTTYQQLSMAALSMADFILFEDEEESAQFQAIRPILGAQSIPALTVKEDGDISDLFQEQELIDFLSSPSILPKKQSIFLRLREEMEQSRDKLIKEQVQQRETQLEWLRKAFTSEIKRLLEENEELKSQLKNGGLSTSELNELEGLRREYHNLRELPEKIEELSNKLKESEIRETALKDAMEQIKETASQNQQWLDTWNDVKSTLESTVNDLELKLEESSQEIQRLQAENHELENSFERFKSHPEFERMKNHIEDLEVKISRYQNQWYYVLFHKFFQFFQIWFFRFPLTLILWCYHVFTMKCHRFFRPR